jgi:dihydrofolate reductase
VLGKGHRLFVDVLSTNFKLIDSANTMNAIPKYVASRTLREAQWNATLISGDVASFMTDLKQENGGSILKAGNGALTRTLMESDLIDEFHLLLTPVAVGKDKHLFGEIDDAPQLLLVDAKRFKNDVMRVIYTPSSRSASRRLLHVAEQ